MRAKLEKRLKELQNEFEAGQKVLADLEAKQANLRDTMLRLSGAIMVLQEELGLADDADNGSPENSQSLANPKTAAGETVS